MAKIHPNFPSISTNGSCSGSSERPETFTIWMKSLVFHGKGCTVFNSRGDIVFRVDNYQKRCSSEVLLMDSTGKVLCSINRKKLGIFGCWEGFKWSENSRAWFQVRRNQAILSKDKSCRVTLKREENMGICYNIMGFEGKSTFKITDISGHIVAEAIQKESREGVRLGDDVLTLKVEANVDHELIMALVTVYGLINNKV